MMVSCHTNAASKPWLTMLHGAGIMIQAATVRPSGPSPCQASLHTSKLHPICILTISSGSHIENCTALTRLIGALEYVKRSMVPMVHARVKQLQQN